MFEKTEKSNPDDVTASWTRVGIASGFLACLVYPIMTLVSLPRIPQVILGASFGPALAVASIAHPTSSSTHALS